MKMKQNLKINKCGWQPNFVNSFSSFVIVGTHVLKLTNERRLRCSERFSPVRISLSHWDSVLHIRTTYTDTTYLHDLTSHTCSLFSVHTSHTHFLQIPTLSHLPFSFFCSFPQPGLSWKRKSLWVCAGTFMLQLIPSPFASSVIFICNFVLTHTFKGNFVLVNKLTLTLPLTKHA